MMGVWGDQWMMGEAGGWVGIFWVVILIDLILLGVWLWKKIQEK